MDTNMGFNVEEASGFGEIDNLLGLLEYGDDSSSSDSSNGSSGLGYKKEDLVDLDVAHVSIPKKDVINVLGISSLLSSGGENSFEGKVTSMKIENGVVRFLLSIYLLQVSRVNHLAMQEKNKVLKMKLEVLSFLIYVGFWSIINLRWFFLKM